MILPLALAIALAAGQALAPDLCVDAPSRIEPDMRIHESDLDQAAATSAADKLKRMIDHGEVDGEFYFGALNQIKIMRGHLMLRQAKADRKEFGPSSVEAKESTSIFCNWLGKEGFWYD